MNEEWNHTIYKILYNLPFGLADTRAVLRNLLDVDEPTKEEKDFVIKAQHLFDGLQSSIHTVQINGLDAQVMFLTDWKA